MNGRVGAVMHHVLYSKVLAARVHALDTGGGIF